MGRYYYLETTLDIRHLTDARRTRSRHCSPRYRRVTGLTLPHDRAAIRYRRPQWHERERHLHSEPTPLPPGPGCVRSTFASTRAVAMTAVLSVTIRDDRRSRWQGEC